jgi:hypothetical protein
MSVEFYEEDQYDFKRRAEKKRKAKKTGLAGFVMRLGLVKTQKSADSILLLFAIVVFAVSIAVLFNGESYSSDTKSRVIRLQTELELEGYEGTELLIELSERLNQ